MIRNVRLHRLVPLAAIIAVLILACRAEAQVKPLKITGGGRGPEGLSIFGFDSAHTATGNATHLGKYSGNGIANVLSFDPETLSGTFEGFFVFVAANGDKLAMTYGNPDNGAEQVGTFQLIDAGGSKVKAVFLAEFNPILDMCTGRFANVVDGSLIMLAESDPFALVVDEEGYSPPFNYTWEGQGWLEFEE
jgi:hypothetical protein